LEGCLALGPELGLQLLRAFNPGKVHFVDWRSALNNGSSRSITPGYGSPPATGKFTLDTGVLRLEKNIAFQRCVPLGKDGLENPKNISFVFRAGIYLWRQI
jgi:hypothetical protein